MNELIISSKLIYYIINVNKTFFINIITEKTNVIIHCAVFKQAVNEKLHVFAQLNLMEWR